MKIHEFTKTSAGKYRGRSLPWIALKDPYYFFNNIDNFSKKYGVPAEEVKLVESLSKSLPIRYPRRRACIITNEHGHFLSMGAVDKFFEYEADKGTIREYRDFIDLSILHRLTVRDLDTQQEFQKVSQRLLLNPKTPRLTVSSAEEVFLKLMKVKSTDHIAPPDDDPIVTDIEQNFSISIPVPSQVLEYIDDNFERVRNKKAKKIVAYMIHMHMLTGEPLYVFRPYARTVKLKILTTRDYDVWGKLVEAGILQIYSNEHGIEYHWKRGIPKRYRINPRWVRPEYLEYNYEIKSKDYPAPDERLVKYMTDCISQVRSHKPENNFEKISRRIYIKHKARTTLSYMSDEEMNQRNKGLLKNETYVDLDSKQFLSEYDLQLRVGGMISKLSLLDHGFVFSSRSELNMRVSHSLTNVDKLLHPFLKVKGETIVEHDLRNSQPLILANILNNILSNVDSPDATLLYEKLIHDYLLTPTHPSHKPTPTLLCSHYPEEDIVGLKEEVNTMLESCRRGEFYESIISGLERKGMIITRSEAKSAFTKTMFGKYNHQTPYKSALRIHFPYMIKFLDGFKQAVYRYFEKGISEKKLKEGMSKYLYSKSQGGKTPFDAGNDYLAISLQEIEALIMVDAVFGKFMILGVWGFTRHDSICFLRKDEPEALKAMTGTLDNIFGMDGYHMNKGVWQ